MNFSTQYLNPVDNSFGGRLQNGSWTGVIGMLQRGEVEVTNVAFLMTSDRLEAVSFTVPLLNVKTYLMIRQPEIYDMKWNAFLAPFTWRLWMMVLLFMMIIAACFGLLYHMGCSYGIVRIRDFSTSTLTFLLVAVFCMQGQTLYTSSAPVRMTLITSYLTAVVLIASYSAEFISHLTMRRPTMPFTDFSEFYQDGSYKLGMVPNSAQIDYFKSSKQDVLHQTYIKMIKPHEASLPKNDIEGLERMCRYKFAYVMSTYNLMYMGKVDACNYVQVPQAFFPGSIGITISKKSPYKGLLNYILQTMRRDGVVHGIYNRFTFRLQQDVSVPTPVIGMSDVTPILTLLIVGTAVSLIVLFLESLKKHKQKPIKWYQ